MRTFSLLEHRSLPHGEGEGCIPLPLADRLLAVAKASVFAGKGEGGVLEDRRNDIRARGIVGVLAAEGCSLEILPKIDVPAPDGSSQERGQIRKRLVDMLAVARDIRIETGRVTELDWQHNTLLEILIRIFADKLTDTLRRGMPRRYLGQEDDLAALRGALDVKRQFTRHAVNPSKLACRFDTLSEDIALNRIMKAAVEHLLRLSRSVANLQKLRELAFVYGEITSVQVSALRWDNVMLDRTNRAWVDLLGMARLFLQQRYQTSSTGVGQGTALLFDMNVLFEDYVGRLIQRAVSGTGRFARLQGGRKYCLTVTDGTDRALFQTRPDILVYEGTEVVQVVDTKWKRISSKIEDPKQGVSQADVYQMMAYAHLYHAPRVTLVYPHHAGLQDDEGIQSRFTISGHSTLIETASLDLSNGHPGRDLIRANILDPAPNVAKKSIAGASAARASSADPALM